MLLVFVIGCTKEDMAPLNVNDNQSGMNLKSTVIQEDPVYLEGITGFGFKAAKEQRVLADPYENFCACTAELTFGDKQSFMLHTKEYFFWYDVPGGVIFREDDTKRAVKVFMANDIY